MKKKKKTKRENVSSSGAQDGKPKRDRERKEGGELIESEQRISGMAYSSSSLLVVSFLFFYFSSSPFVYFFSFPPAVLYIFILLFFLFSPLLRYILCSKEES